MLIQELTDIIIESTRKNIILNKIESSKLLEKMLNDIAGRYEDDSAFLVLEKISFTGCKLLK